MGWDVVLFSSGQQITDLQAVDESLLTPIDFDVLMQQHFANRVQHSEHVAIQGPDFSISYYTGPPVSNKIFTLRGENALYALVRIAAAHSRNYMTWRWMLL